ncbi:uncharacterized protein TNCV_1803731 [Trichonephila clavipes]|nr:uncharacterized protein TNCV_1803731 [Trichonephila clavipes]
MEDETFNDSDINNNLIDYEDEQEEPDSQRVHKIYFGIQIFNKSQKQFLKIDTNSERSLKFQKEFRSCITGYREQATDQPTVVSKTYHLSEGAKK